MHLRIYATAYYPLKRNENAYNLRNHTDYSNPFTRMTQKWMDHAGYSDTWNQVEHQK
jgi:hypothetical protein